jgi:hypothetical protein
MVKLGEAVGIIAAQSIGEPGTQLDAAHLPHRRCGRHDDITQGLPRIEELFEARTPKGEAVISEIDGVVDDLAGKATCVSCASAAPISNAARQKFRPATVLVSATATGCRKTRLSPASADDDRRDDSWPAWMARSSSSA